MSPHWIWIQQVKVRKLSLTNHSTNIQVNRMMWSEKLVDPGALQFAKSLHLPGGFKLVTTFFIFPKPLKIAWKPFASWSQNKVHQYPDPQWTETNPWKGWKCWGCSALQTFGFPHFPLCQRSAFEKLFQAKHGNTYCDVNTTTGHKFENHVPQQIKKYLKKWAYLLCFLPFLFELCSNDF